MMQWLFLWFSHPVMFNSLQLHGLSLTISQSLLRFMSIASVMPSSHLILWHPLFLLPSIFPSIRDFFNESVVHIRWPKYRVLASASVFPMTIQGRFPLRLTGLISLLCKHLWVQHHSSKASILWCSFFFMVQLSQLYMTNGKTIALTIWTLVSRVISLLFNTLSRFVTAFLFFFFKFYFIFKPETLFFQRTSIFKFHDSCHHPQWFWSPQRGNLSLLPTFPFYLPCSNGAGSWKKQESSRKASISALLTMPKPLTMWITINCGKFWKRWEFQTTWSASWDICMQVRKQQLELNMEQQTGSK